MSAATRPPTALSVWVTHSLDTVFRDTPAPARRELAISLLAAKGEYEAAQIIIAPGRDLEAVTASAS